MNNIFRAYGCYKRAIKLLKGIVKVTDSDFSENDKCDLLAVCLANAAVCFLKSAILYNSESKESTQTLSDYLVPCIKCCEQAIKIKPTYCKAWFRLAQVF